MELSEKIKNEIDLVSYIEATTGQGFKNDGQSLVLNPCPLCGHNDCFKISKSKPNLFYCFSCNAKGSVIDFKMQYSKCSASEAIQQLANEYNIKYSREIVSQKHTNSNQNLASHIWENSNPLDTETARGILERRGFGKYAYEMAENLASIARVNEYSGKSWLILPQVNNGEVKGIHQIQIKDLHTKKDIESKIGLFFLSAGKNKHICIIVESFFNAKALNCLGYTTLVMLGSENKKAIEIWLPEIRKYCSKVLTWLDRGKEKKSWQYNYEFSLDGYIQFENDRENNFDINDLLRESDKEFASNVEDSAQPAGR